MLSIEHLFEWIMGQGPPIPQIPWDLPATRNSPDLVLHSRPVQPLGARRRPRGDVAQLEEHRVRIAGVRGSSPLISTTPPAQSGWRALHAEFAAPHGATVMFTDNVTGIGVDTRHGERDRVGAARRIDMDRVERRGS